MLIIFIAALVLFPGKSVADGSTTQAPSANVTNVTTTATAAVTTLSTTTKAGNLSSINNSTTTVTTSTASVTESTRATSNTSQSSSSNTTTSANQPTANSSTTTSATEGVTTTSAPQITIIEEVKGKWVEIVSATNFTGSVLNGVNASDFNGTDFVNAVVSYYKSSNESSLTNFLQEHNINEVAEQILASNIDLLEEEIRDQFNGSGDVLLRGFFTSVHWLKEFVLLEGGEKFSELLTLYNAYVATNYVANATQQNQTQPYNATLTKLVQFILSNASGSEMFQSICRAAATSSITAPVCPGSETTVQASEKFRENWSNIVSYNYTFLNETSREEMNRISSENMTMALALYVRDMTTADIQTLLDANATKFVSSQLRTSGNSVSDSLGQTTINLLAEDVTKEDVYYLYLNFMNGITSTPQGFEPILRDYLSVETSQSKRKKRSTSPCDRSSISAGGLWCYVITVKANNLTFLADVTCGEFNSSTTCRASFVISVDDTEGEASGGLSTGAIVGIVIGSVFAIILLVLLIYYVWRRCSKNKSKVNPQDELSYDENAEIEMNVERRDTRATNGSTVGRLSTSS